MGCATSKVDVQTRETRGNHVPPPASMKVVEVETETKVVEMKEMIEDQADAEEITEDRDPDSALDVRPPICLASNVDHHVAHDVTLDPSAQDNFPEVVSEQSTQNISEGGTKRKLMKQRSGVSIRSGGGDKGSGSSTLP